MSESTRTSTRQILPQADYPGLLTIRLSLSARLVHLHQDNDGADDQYELDSLCGFLKITRSYYSNTKDSSFINQNWLDAVDQIMQVIEDQSKPSFDEDYNFFSAYNWTGLAGALSGPVTNGGNNAPKAYTGLVATHHRPSDDLSLLRELIASVRADA